MRDFVARSAASKLRRGEEGITQLGIILSEYEANRPAYLTADTRYFDKFIGVAISRAPPEMTSILFGEIIHSLRCALDHLMYSYLNHEGTELAENQIQFPLSGKSEERFETLIKSLNIKNLVVEQYLRGLALFPKGKCTELMAIHKLDNIDKHRMLLTSVVTVNVANVVLRRRSLSGVDEEQLLPPSDISAESTDARPMMPNGPQGVAYAVLPLANYTSAPDSWRPDTSLAKFSVRIEAPDLSAIIGPVPIIDGLKRLADAVRKVLESTEHRALPV